MAIFVGFDDNKITSVVRNTKVAVLTLVALCALLCFTLIYGHHRTINLENRLAELQQERLEFRERINTLTTNIEAQIAEKHRLEIETEQEVLKRAKENELLIKQELIKRMVDGQPKHN